MLEFVFKDLINNLDIDDILEANSEEQAYTRVNLDGNLTFDDVLFRLRRQYNRAYLIEVVHTRFTLKLVFGLLNKGTDKFVYKLFFTLKGEIR